MAPRLRRARRGRPRACVALRCGLGWPEGRAYAWPSRHRERGFQPEEEGSLLPSRHRRQPGGSDPRAHCGRFAAAPRPRTAWRVASEGWGCRRGCAAAAAGRRRGRAAQEFDAPRVAQWLIRRVKNPEVPGSRLARVCDTLGGALVVWPLTPWLIWINWLGNPQALAGPAPAGGRPRAVGRLRRSPREFVRVQEADGSLRPRESRYAGRPPWRPAGTVAVTATCGPGRAAGSANRGWAARPARKPAAASGRSLSLCRDFHAIGCSARVQAARASRVAAPRRRLETRDLAPGAGTRADSDSSLRFILRP